MFSKVVFLSIVGSSIFSFMNERISLNFSISVFFSGFVFVFFYVVDNLFYFGSKFYSYVSEKGLVAL